MEPTLNEILEKFIAASQPQRETGRSHVGDCSPARFSK